MASAYNKMTASSIILFPTLFGACFEFAERFPFWSWGKGIRANATRDNQFRQRVCWDLVND